MSLNHSSDSNQKSVQPQLSNREYTVGWICAIPEEYTAARAILDQEHQRPLDSSQHEYTLGRIGQHNVAIAILPNGEYGTAAASSVASNILHSFPNIKIGLMVGIAGGAPNSRHDIRLADVVVSAPRGPFGGVLQYDFGRTRQNQSFQGTRVLNQPPTILREAISGMISDFEMKGHSIKEDVQSALQKWPRLQKTFSEPNPDTDILYRSDIIHPLDSESEPCADSCDIDGSCIIVRRQRDPDEDNPAIHYGLIATANQVMKDAKLRDKLANEKNVLCFEMEAGGLMNHFPCLVIRGIADYADSHKNEQWRGYAAMTAAAYAKDMLRRISPSRVHAEQSISDLIFGISTEIKDLAIQQLDQSYNALLEWLTPVDYSVQQNTNFQKRQDGTGEWLFVSEHFQTWITRGCNTMFCPGIPGAGKTIVTSIVVNHLYSVYQSHHSNIAIAYIFFSYQQKQYQTLDMLLAGLLKQLVRFQQQPSDIMQNLYSRNEKRQTRPSVTELVAAIHSIARLHSTVFFILDALDECDSKVLARFLSTIFELQDTCTVQIFATSRFNMDIQDKFSGAIIQEIQADANDISRYVSANIGALPTCVQASQQLQEEIKVEISEAVSGMFLLARIYLNLLGDKITPNDIRSTLKKLKKQTSGSTEQEKMQVLDQAYEKVFDIINSQQQGRRTFAQRVLLWMVSAKRHMTVCELQNALAVNFGSSSFHEGDITPAQDIVSVCAGLVTVDKESNVVQLAHYTTYEFIKSIQRDWFQEPQSIVSNTCLTYLSYDAFRSGPCQTDSELDMRLESYPFYFYAAKYWGYHLHESNSIKPNSLELLKDTAKLESMCQVLTGCDGVFLRRCTSFTRHMTPLHLAAYFGIIKLIDELTISGKSMDPNKIDDTDSNGMTPLLLAAERGNRMAFELLLDRGANMAVVTKGGLGSMHIAACHGHVNILELLLHRGSCKLSNQTQRIQGTDVSDGEMKTPLHHAVLNEHIGCVKLLLRYGAKLLVDADNMTPLHYAVFKNNEEQVRCFIDNGTSVDTAVRRKWYQSTYDVEDVSYRAIRNTESGQQLNCTNGLTSLHYAVLTGSTRMTRLLLEIGADPNAVSLYGETPLHLAVKNDLYESGYQSFRDHWNDPIYRIELPLDLFGYESEDEIDYTKAQVAIDTERLGILDILLNYSRININTPDSYGMTPLHCLSYKQSTSSQIIQRLIQRGADTTLRDHKGQTPLHLACYNGDVDVIAYLLSNGADMTATDLEGQNIFHFAAKGGSVETLLAVVDYFDEMQHLDLLSSRDQHGRNALHHLFLGPNRNELNMVNYMLYLGVSSKDVDRFNMSPLATYLDDFLVYYNPQPIARLLLESGADPRIKTSKGHSLAHLHVKSTGVQVEVLALLANYGVDFTTTDNDQRTVLHQSCLSGSLTKESYWFLRNITGLNKQMLDKKGKSPLTYAVEMCQTERHPNTYDSDRWSRIERILSLDHELEDQ